MQKINESCAKTLKASKGYDENTAVAPYINVDELELGLATKGRAASVDHVGAKRRLRSASRGGRKPENSQSNAMLPSIA